MLYNIDCGAINIKLTVNIITHDEQSLTNTYIFPLRHISTFLSSETLASTLALCLGSVLNSKNTKLENVKSVALNGPQEGHTYLQYKIWNKQTNHHLQQQSKCTSGGWNFQLCAHLQMTRKGPQHWLRSCS